MANNIVVVQPSMGAPPSAPTIQTWSTGLCDCCDDMSACCYGFWCFPCFACSTSASFGENVCLPLCDILSPAITAYCGLPFCAPPALLSLRVAVRHRYGLQGTICNDILTSCFCELCAWCQIAREIKIRKKTPAISNMQHQSHNVLINM
ncbi:placenta-specific gene 8 protein-like [Lampris incognitus]|uniref:placenta-specific gene 8 protein-like n=1 Tax=Lampris incognitus TaxID=2546036 RepID=UPI0024B51440|nr:placenta-specific gene 8 protein-like [Lampris incognitus]